MLRVWQREVSWHDPTHGTKRKPERKVGSYLEIENEQRSTVLGVERGGAGEAILEKACSSATTPLPAMKSLLPKGFAQRSASAALCREEIGPCAFA
jgi:hypothetical protein